MIFIFIPIGLWGDTGHLLACPALLLIGFWSLYKFLPRESFLVPRFIFIRLALFCAIYPIQPTIAKLVMYDVVQTAIFVIAEIILDELRALRHRLSTPPSKYGNVVTFMRSSNNGYLSDQFIKVQVCDTRWIEDPFWPHHRSNIYVIEIRRRCSVWLTVIIWSISMLDGDQRKIHEFQQFCGWSDGQLWIRRYSHDHYWTRMVYCYESNGLIMIRFNDMNQLLHVYDIRYGKSATFKFSTRSEPHFPRHPLAMYCVRRLLASDGSVDGWLILALDWGYTRVQFGPRRTRMINETFDLRQNAISISHEEIVFGGAEPVVLPVHSTNGSVGFYNAGRTMLYDPSMYSYVYYRNFALIPASINISFGQSAVFRNDRERILVTIGGIVERVQLVMPSLKYLAAKAFIQKNPHLCKTITAAEFRKSTGIDMMKGHFP